MLYNRVGFLDLKVKKYVANFQFGQSINGKVVEDDPKNISWKFDIDEENCYMMEHM